MPRLASARVRLVLSVLDAEPQSGRFASCRDARCELTDLQAAACELVKIDGHIEESGGDWDRRQRRNVEGGGAEPGGEAAAGTGHGGAEAPSEMTPKLWSPRVRSWLRHSARDDATRFWCLSARRSSFGCQARSFESYTTARQMPFSKIAPNNPAAAKAAASVAAGRSDF